MRTAVAATALGITLTLAGLSSCAGPGAPGLTPGPEPSGTPVFASEEEALAAAEELYGDYQTFSNALGQAGWADPSGYDEWLTGDALADEIRGAESLSAKGVRQVGDATFDTLSLQQIEDFGEKVSLTVYLCSDVSAVDVIDANGLSIVSPERPDRQSLEIEMNNLDGSLKISRRDAWSGASFC